MNDEFLRVEEERLARVRREFKDFDKFSLKAYDVKIDCTLKHYVLTYMNYNLKWPHLQDLSLYEWVSLKL